MTEQQWRDSTRRLWKRHHRACQLMMRPGLKRRTRKKWMSEYIRTLDRIPNPETCISPNHDYVLRKGDDLD